VIIKTPAFSVVKNGSLKKLLQFRFASGWGRLSTQITWNRSQTASGNNLNNRF